MIFCLSNANIAHFRNNTQNNVSISKHIKCISVSFYEIHNFLNMIYNANIESNN